VAALVTIFLPPGQGARFQQRSDKTCGRCNGGKSASVRHREG
jgi:hypothetical protein